MKTILILDDEQAVRESFLDYFEDCQWQTIQAESGEQALKLIENELVEAAVVDVRLPGMDGHDFIRKAYLMKQKIAFVICTGSPEYIVPPDLLELPCMSGKLFKKPVESFAELEEKIIRIMGYLKNNGESNE